MFSAVVSSSSIGGWVIWRDLGWLWGSLIALSQVLTAIKPFLPFKKRLSALANLGNEMEEMFIQAESKWYSIKEGELSNPEIHKEWIELKSRIHKATRKHFGDSTLPPNQKFLDKARRNGKLYFEAFYS